MILRLGRTTTSRHEVNDAGDESLTEGVRAEGEPPCLLRDQRERRFNLERTTQPKVSQLDVT
eukprot:35030-Eustigmatos_ZCMA.PRE.1